MNGFFFHRINLSLPVYLVPGVIWTNVTKAELLIALMETIKRCDLYHPGSKITQTQKGTAGCDVQSTHPSRHKVGLICPRDGEGGSKPTPLTLPHLSFSAWKMRLSRQRPKVLGILILALTLWGSKIRDIQHRPRALPEHLRRKSRGGHFGCYWRSWFYVLFSPNLGPLSHLHKVWLCL